MIPVILSGGSGSRLWPISRSSYPKQFCDIFDEPLLAKTLKRLSGTESPYVVTVKSLNVLTEKSMKNLGLSVENVIYEPCPRNTAPAVALLCYHLSLKQQADKVVGIFPADHMIANDAEFKRVVNFAATCAEKGTIVTVGIEPAYPATGFGYIECQGESIAEDGHLKALKVSGFREKPDVHTATKFIESGNYFWNAGMFVFKVDVMIKAFQEHMPELWQQIIQIKPDMSNLADVYENIKSSSIDTGIMEKFKNQVCVPCDIGWNDLGSWDDFAKLMSGASGGTAETIEIGGKNNFVFSSRAKTIGLVAVEDLIVIDTPDALLISKKNHSQEIKLLVDKLSQNKSSKVKDHTFDERPWGRYEIISDTSDYKIKVIMVDPGQQISYQSHGHRSEHWVVIVGEGVVVLDEKPVPVKPGSSIVIPQQTKHRIKNTGTMPLRFVEVQTGDYFGEDDIVRYEDDYKRV
jgi:mannose-1-phosphate guanylyltransferase/mannose-1-phosphate guanylyltransferase/mannose-6-phosphate isomerase